MDDHSQISWFHSIDIGNGVTTKGGKSAAVLAAEFNNLGLSLEALQGKRVLDIGCNDGYMSLRCATLGADVTAIDGVGTPGLQFVRRNLKPEFRFYAMDMLSPTFYELGRFDIILYLGVLYHTMYPFEHLLRLVTACRAGAVLFLESFYADLPGSEELPTLVFNYDGSVASDWTTPSVPSVAWIEQTLVRVGFGDITIINRKRGAVAGHGRVTMRARFSDSDPASPFLFAAGQRI